MLFHSTVEVPKVGPVGAVCGGIFWIHSKTFLQVFSNGERNIVIVIHTCAEGIHVREQLRHATAVSFTKSVFQWNNMVIAALLWVYWIVALFGRPFGNVKAFV
jgi:hypothetical protein